MSDDDRSRLDTERIQQIAAHAKTEQEMRERAYGPFVTSSDVTQFVGAARTLAHKLDKFADRIDREGGFSDRLAANTKVTELLQEAIAGEDGLIAAIKNLSRLLDQKPA